MTVAFAFCACTTCGRKARMNTACSSVHSATPSGERPRSASTRRRTSGGSSASSGPAAPDTATSWPRAHSPVARLHDDAFGASEGHARACEQDPHVTNRTRRLQPGSPVPTIACSTRDLSTEPRALESAPVWRGSPSSANRPTAGSPSTSPSWRRACASTATSRSSFDSRRLPFRRDYSHPHRDLQALGALVRALDGFDLVHAHAAKAGVVGRLAARLRGCPRSTRRTASRSSARSRRRASASGSRWSARSRRGPRR